MRKVLVLGGTNIDIVGYSNAQIVKNDSNPGVVNFSYGGVGRNIAVNMKKMGLDVNMITAFGNDSFKELLLADFENRGISVEHSVFSECYPSSVYLCVLDGDKELDLAINSMDVIHEINNIPFLKKNLAYINQHDFVLIDGNLSTEAIKFLVDNVKSKIVVDGVSSIKVVKFKKVINAINSIKVNRLEASALLEMEINNEEELVAAGKQLVDNGVSNVFITDGANGAFAFTKKDYSKFQVETKGIVNVTGAGDAFSAGVVYGLVNDYTIENILKFSTLAARYALLTVDTVADNLEVNEILKELNE